MINGVILPDWSKDKETKDDAQGLTPDQWQTQTV